MIAAQIVCAENVYCEFFLSKALGEFDVSEPLNG